MLRQSFQLERLHTQCLAEAHSSFVTAGLSVCAPGCVSLSRSSALSLCRRIHCPRFTPTSSVVLRRSFQLERLHEYAVPRRSSQQLCHCGLERVCSWLCVPLKVSLLCRSVTESIAPVSPPTPSVVLRRSFQLERLHEYAVPRRSSQQFCHCGLERVCSWLCVPLLCREIRSASPNEAHSRSTVVPHLDRAPRSDTSNMLLHFKTCWVANLAAKLLPLTDPCHDRDRFVQLTLSKSGRTSGVCHRDD